jgi:anionic cell wall polymer biosynthesis LytR-Cps2A-Psr (LCP) family protein
MNGERALQFVRSRHAEGTEGTDVAREARQQKIIGAIENKLIDPKIFLNIKNDLKIWKVVMASVETDIDITSGTVLARKGIDSINSITKYIIPENLLVNPPTSSRFDNQYVFIPKLGSGRWEDMYKWVDSVLN